MPFFQNPFLSEFQANWLLGDRQYTPTFTVPGNTGRGEELVRTWNTGPYNLSGNDADGEAKSNLNIIYAIHERKNWATLSIDLTAGVSSSAAVTPQEVLAILSANAIFAEKFTASLVQVDQAPPTWNIQIRQKWPITNMWFYIANGRAEEVMKFNARAGVAELPTYFSRHTIDNRFTFTDSQNSIIELDPSGSDVDAAIIDNAVNFKGTSLGYDSGTVREDWEILRGKSGIFNFQKITVDGSNRITQIIQYPAGAQAGDLGRKIKYTYTGGNTQPDTIAELPYTIQSGDLITP